MDRGKSAQPRLAEKEWNVRDVGTRLARSLSAQSLRVFPLPMSLPQSEVQKLCQEVARLRSQLDRVYLCPKDLLQRYRCSRAKFYRTIKPALPPAPAFPGGLWPLREIVRLEEDGNLPRPAL